MYVGWIQCRPGRNIVGTPLKKCRVWPSCRLNAISRWKRNEKSNYGPSALLRQERPKSAVGKIWRLVSLVAFFSPTPSKAARRICLLCSPQKLLYRAQSPDNTFAHDLRAVLPVLRVCFRDILSRPSSQGSRKLNQMRLQDLSYEPLRMWT